MGQLVRKAFLAPISGQKTKLLKNEVWLVFLAFMACLGVEKAFSVVLGCFWACRGAVGGGSALGPDFGPKMEWFKKEV